MRSGRRRGPIIRVQRTEDEHRITDDAETDPRILCRPEQRPHTIIVPGTGLGHDDLMEGGGQIHPMHYVHTRLVSEPEHVQARTIPDFEHLRGPIGTGDGSEFTSHGFQHVVLPSACLEIMRLRIIVRRNLVVVCRQPSNLRVARSSAMLASILARWPCSCPMQRVRE